MSSRVIRSTGDESQKVSPFRLHWDGSERGSCGHETPASDLLRPENLHVSHPDNGSAVTDSLRAAEIEKQAYERGFADGQKAGLELGEKATEPLLEQYARSLDQLKKLRREVLVASEREVVRLALEVARKIVRREIAIDEELTLTLVKVALSRIEDQSLITIRVNPKDHGIIRRYQAVRSDNDALGEGIKLVEDPLISRGGCVIETESGIIDARVEEQFREIEKGFLE
jgi:flagellar assembly protein FliH